MVRTQISFCLEVVISQQLIVRSDGMGRVMGCEILLPNAAIRNLIREDKTHQIYSQMQMGQGKHGMLTLNQSLAGHVKSGALTPEGAVNRSYDPEELIQMLANARDSQAEARGGRDTGTGRRTNRGTGGFSRR